MPKAQNRGVERVGSGRDLPSQNGRDLLNVSHAYNYGKETLLLYIVLLTVSPRILRLSVCQPE